jgi:hypothetical protein
MARDVEATCRLRRAGDTGREDRLKAGWSASTASTSFTITIEKGR